MVYRTPRRSPGDGGLLDERPAVRGVPGRVLAAAPPPVAGRGPRVGGSGLLDLSDGLVVLPSPEGGRRPSPTYLGGAVLASLADTLMPDAYREGGPLVAFATAAGFLLSF